MLELPPGVPEPISKPGIKWSGYFGMKRPNDPMYNERITPNAPVYYLSEDEARYLIIREWWSSQPQDDKWRQMNTDLNAYYFGSGKYNYDIGEYQYPGIGKKLEQFKNTHQGNPNAAYVYDITVANLIN
jgi:hypothetical protein